MDVTWDKNFKNVFVYERIYVCNKKFVANVIKTDAVNFMNFYNQLH